MNKILLNARSRNHIKILPARDGLNLNIPEGADEKIKWCERTFHNLQHGLSVKRLAYYSHRRKGYRISVWEMDDLYYLCVSIRTISGQTYVTTIYIDTEREQLLSIAKFLDKNNERIMSDYKDQILEARDALIKAKLEEKADAVDA